MNRDIVAGNWQQLMGKLARQWGKLTDDRRRVIAGERVELAGRMQESYGLAKDQAAQQLEAFRRINKDCRAKRALASN